MQVRPQVPARRTDLACRVEGQTLPLRFPLVGCSFMYSTISADATVSAQSHPIRQLAPSAERLGEVPVPRYRINCVCRGM